jgi:tripartite-type tricarboxylate transporter receptor subunit TctC
MARLARTTRSTALRLDTNTRSTKCLPARLAWRFSMICTALADEMLTLHLAAEMFVDQAGIQARHIPYKGVGPMMTDLIGGQVDFGVLSLPSVLSQLKSGSLRAVGLGGKERTPALPDLPTVAEQGLPDYYVEGWFAVIAPARLPAEKVKEVYSQVSSAYADTEVKKSMATQGNTILTMSPDDTARFFQTELDKYAKVVKAAGMELK